MTKRKIATHPDWDRILRSRSAVSTIADENFQVTAPMAAEYPDHNSLCVLADGYSWLRCFPQSPHHIMTFMFDADGHVLQLWVDVCLDHGIDAAGLSWWDDLYLDIVVLPDGYLEMQNADELADALADRSITQVQFDLVHKEAQMLTTRLQSEYVSLMNYASVQRQHLLPLVADHL